MHKPVGDGCFAPKIQDFEVKGLDLPSVLDTVSQLPFVDKITSPSTETRSTEEGGNDSWHSGSSHGDEEVLSLPSAVDIDLQHPMKIPLPDSFTGLMGPSSLVVATLDDTRFGHVDPETSHFTTVMLRNIPNRCTRKMLIERLDDGFRGTFDFVYMPIDFSKHCNMGYAFINFKEPHTCRMFIMAFHGVKSKVCLLSCNSAKVCEVTYARLQGLKENVYSLQNSLVMDQLVHHKEWQPVLFDDQGDAVSFPKEKIAMDEGLRESRGRRRRSRQGEDSRRRFETSVHVSHVENTPQCLAPWDEHMNFTGHRSMHPAALYHHSGCTWQPWSPAVPTTVMLRNIPNHCTRDYLLERLNQEFAETFDFLYMPMDFKNYCNMGYAFINFKDIAFCHHFAATFHGVETSVCLPGFGSGKICQVTPARVQGLHANIQRLRHSNVGDQLADHPEWQPLIFNEIGDPRAFLMHRNVRDVESMYSAMCGPTECGWDGQINDASPAFGPRCVLGKRESEIQGTVMLRNIPNNYTRSMLLQRLSPSFRGTFDFLYLPMDFESCCNMGYAFINFRDMGNCKRFMREFDGVECRVCLPGFNSAKICRVTFARVQGLDGNIRHLRNSTIMRDLAKHPDWQPLVFTPHGEPAPLP